MRCFYVLQKAAEAGEGGDTVMTQTFMGSVKNVGVEDTPRISEPLSFFEKTLFSSAPTGVSHR